MDETMLQQASSDLHDAAHFVPVQACGFADNFGSCQQSSPAAPQNPIQPTVMNFSTHQHLYHTSNQHQAQPLQHLEQPVQFGYYQYQNSSSLPMSTAGPDPSTGADQWAACGQSASSYTHCTHWPTVDQPQTSGCGLTYAPSYATADCEPSSGWHSSAPQSVVYPTMVYEKATIDSRQPVLGRATNPGLLRNNLETSPQPGPCLAAPPNYFARSMDPARPSPTNQKQQRASARAPAAPRSATSKSSAKSAGRNSSAPNRQSVGLKLAGQSATNGSCNGPTATTSLTGQTSNMAPCELENFAEGFKQRRIKLGVTQADVGKALATLQLPGVGSLSQSTICRFESLTLSHNNMIALKPILQAWLETAEGQAKQVRPGQPPYYTTSSPSALMDHKADDRERITMAPELDTNTSRLEQANPSVDSQQTMALSHAAPPLHDMNDSSCEDSSSLSSAGCADHHNEQALAEGKCPRKRKSAESCSDSERSGSRRNSIAAHEKRLLEIHFEQISRPTSEQLQSIADKLDMDKNTVRIWFCNQRQKKKRLKYTTVIANESTTGKSIKTEPKLNPAQASQLKAATLS